MQTIIKTLTSISITMANTLYASLAWSGAARFVNEFNKPEAESKVFLYLASLASKITVPELKPTTAQVLALIRTAPEKVYPTGVTLKNLIAAGETKESIKSMVDLAHAQALVRFDAQVKHVALNEDAITLALDKAFAKKQVAFVKPSDALQDILVAKMWVKVQARKTRIVADVTSGNYVDEGLIELKAINKLLEKESKAA